MSIIDLIEPSLLEFVVRLRRSEEIKNVSLPISMTVYEVQALLVADDLVMKFELTYILFEGDNLLQLHTWWLVIKWLFI